MSRAPERVGECHTEPCSDKAGAERLLTSGAGPPVRDPPNKSGMAGLTQETARPLRDHLTLNREERSGDRRLDVRFRHPGDDTFHLFHRRLLRVDIVGYHLAAAHDDDAVDHLEDMVDVVRDEDAGMA